jgi:deoxycytidine triphosphate deaminase
MQCELLVKQQFNLEAFPNMPRTITCEELAEAVENGTFIKGGAKESAEGIKYDFRMGSRVLKASKGRPVDLDKLTEAEMTEMVIEPGEVVFVLSEESLALPKNIMAQLVPKRKLSHEGIIVLGGFCVDPLYEGKLLVGLFNYSSTRWALDAKRKLIAAVFFELQENEMGTMPIPKEAITDFPTDLKRTIAAYQPIDLKGLNDEIKSLEGQIVNLRDEITTDREWKKDFQSKLEIQATNIDKLLEGLDEEKENRLAAEKSISEQIAGVRVTQGQVATQQSGNNTLLITILAIVLTAILSIGLTLFGVWFTKKAEQPQSAPQIQQPQVQAPQPALQPTSLPAH